MVASITFAIVVMICLVGIGNVRTVIQVILMTVLIYVLIVIALISNQIIISVRLQGSET